MLMPIRRGDGGATDGLALGDDEVVGVEVGSEDTVTVLDHERVLEAERVGVMLAEMVEVGVGVFVGVGDDDAEGRSWLTPRASSNWRPVRTQLVIAAPPP